MFSSHAVLQDSLARQTRCEHRPPTKERGQFSMCNDLLLYGSRIVIPRDLQEETLQKIHQGHQGIQKCRQRVLASVWWPGVTRRMEQYVLSCPHCIRLHYLPPYSPDLNPAEGVFSQIKCIMKQNHKLFQVCSAPRSMMICIYFWNGYHTRLHWTHFTLWLHIILM